MSAENRKRNFLIGFGAVALVLAVFVAVRPPSWPREDASGAIGAVEKHREPQITQKDVVLTDEATRREEAELYGDFLDDAAKLQTISANIAVGSEADLEARALAARDAMLKHEADLEARFAARQAARLQALDNDLQARIVAARKAGSDQLESDLQGLEARKLYDRDAENLQARLQAVSRELGLGSAGRVADHDALQSQLRAIELANADLAARNYARMSARLSAEAEAMEARATRNLQARLSSDAEFAARLAGIERSLAGVRQLAARNASTIDAKIQSRLQASLKDAEQAVGARRAEYQARLQGRIQSELAAMDRYLQSREEIAARLGAGKALEARVVGARQLNAMAEARMDLQAKMAARPSFAKYQEARSLEARSN